MFWHTSSYGPRKRWERRQKQNICRDNGQELYKIYQRNQPTNLTCSTNPKLDDKFKTKWHLRISCQMLNICDKQKILNCCQIKSSHYIQRRELKWWQATSEIMEAECRVEKITAAEYGIQKLTHTLVVNWFFTRMSREISGGNGADKPIKASEPQPFTP